MNILHISPYYPDADTNHAGGVCMGHEIEALREIADVHILTFISQPFDEELDHRYKDYPDRETVRISGLTRAVHAALEPVMPGYFAARTSVRFWFKLIRAVKKYNIDAIHAEYSSMGQYMAVRKFFPGLKFNLVVHDVTSQSYERKLDIEKPRGFKRGYLVSQIKKIRKCEKKYFLGADTLFAFCEKDIRLIAKCSGRRDTVLINTYTGISDEELSGPCDMSHKEADTVCFLGQMGRPENERAALRLIDICIKVREKIPGIKLFIVGNNPGEALIAKASAESFVTVTGYVGDVDIYIKRAMLSVFPLDEGAGIKVKVLRSMALGTPVITGQVGAEGIDEEGSVIVLAETDEDYVRAVEAGLRNPEETRLKGLLSRKYIAGRFMFGKTREVFKRVYG